MLRRNLLIQRAFLRNTTVLLSGGNPLPSYNPAYSSSQLPTESEREAEIKREAELRARVVKSMPMGFPTLDSTVYASYETSPGQFNNGGAGLSGSTASGNSQQSSTASTAISPAGSTIFSKFPSVADMFKGPNSNAGDSGAQQQPKGAPPGMTDYFVFFTGLVLIAYSIKLFLKGAGTAADGSLVPMWVATPILKAKYLVFSIITTENEREALKSEFAKVQPTMPFLSFFDWLDQRYPNWAAGRKYPQQEQVFGLVAQAIGPTSNSTSIARLTSAVVQKRAGGLFGLGTSSTYTDRPTVVDELVDAILPAIPPRAPSTPPPPPSAPFGQFSPEQWGMPTAGGAPPMAMAPPPQQQYNGVAAIAPPLSPTAYIPNPNVIPPQPQFYNNTSYVPGVSAAPVGGYFQQPQQAELRGTQDISIADITGGAGVVPQHHYAGNGSSQQ